MQGYAFAESLDIAKSNKGRLWHVFHLGTGR